jgi:predicted lipoprotein
MYSNYKLGFIRSAPRTAAPQAPQATAAAPKMAAASTPFASRTQGTVTKSNRFSVNRLIHVKNSGGCRSCGS